MKVRADEHVSIHIVRAVRDMALSDGWELTQVIEVGDRGSSDEHWATKFAREGGHAILSGDTDFFKHHQLVIAINHARLRVVHMPPKWSNARCELQASHMLLWWRRIEKILESMSPLECYRPPWNISEDGELLKIKVNYHDAEHHRKREVQRVERRKAAINVTPINSIKDRKSGQ